MDSRGKLIVIEGTDKSGKETQAKLLVERMRKEGLSVEYYSFPRYNQLFGGLIGQYLNGDFGKKEDIPPEFVALLYSLDRYQIKKELEDKLRDGVNLVVDRYSQSNMAHQSAKLRAGPEQNEFLQWVKVVESRLPKPFRKVFLNMPLEVAEKLMMKEGEEKKHKHGKIDQHERDVEHLMKARAIYQRMQQHEDDWIQIICAVKSGNEFKAKQKDEIHEELWLALRKFFIKK